MELNKFNKDYSTLDRWVTFLNRAYEIDVNKIPEELAIDKEIKKAIEKLDIMYLDSEEREIYENDLKAMRDYKAGLKTAERKGREEGIRQLILKQYAKGLSVEYIADINDIEVEYVRKIIG